MNVELVTLDGLMEKCDILEAERYIAMKIAELIVGRLENKKDS